MIELLEQRRNQLLTLTAEDRETIEDDSHPILHAEAGPNRFYIMTLFFSDVDGIRMEEDLDLSELTIEYFTDTETVKLEEGDPLYEWAAAFYRAN